MKKSVGIMAVLLTASMTFLGVAVAAEVAKQPRMALSAPMVVVDEEAGTVTIALSVEAVSPDCSDDSAPSGSAAPDIEAGYAAADCVTLVLEHPSGKTHRGAIVSTAAKALHPKMLDGIKRGEIVSWVAIADHRDDDDDGGIGGGGGAENPSGGNRPDDPGSGNPGGGNRPADPGSGNPGNGSPGNGNPENGNPGNGNPGNGNPGNGNPENGNPGNGNPGNGNPGNGNSGNGNPENGNPENGNPGNGNPGNGHGPTG